jgi:hypothetical protein
VTEGPRVEMDERISRVRDLMAELSPRLSAHCVESAQELLDNDEPNEALIVVSWGIATDRVQVPPEVLRFIEETVGDPEDLPVDTVGTPRAPTPSSIALPAGPAGCRHLSPMCRS